MTIKYLFCVVASVCAMALLDRFGLFSVASYIAGGVFGSILMHFLEGEK